MYVCLQFVNNLDLRNILKINHFYNCMIASRNYKTHKHKTLINQTLICNHPRTCDNYSLHLLLINFISKTCITTVIAHKKPHEVANTLNLAISAFLSQCDSSFTTETAYKVKKFLYILYAHIYIRYITYVKCVQYRSIRNIYLCLNI